MAVAASVKFRFEPTGETHRVAMQSSSMRRLSMEDICKELLPSWFGAQPEFTLKYKDEEGDWVTITSDVELTEALMVAGSEGRTVLTLAVFPSRAAALRQEAPSASSTNASARLSPPFPSHPVPRSGSFSSGKGYGQCPLRIPRYKHVSFDFDLSAEEFAELSLAEQAWFRALTPQQPVRGAAPHLQRGVVALAAYLVGAAARRGTGARFQSSGGISSPEDFFMQLSLARSLEEKQDWPSGSMQQQPTAGPAAGLIHAFSGLDDVVTATAAILQAFAPSAASHGASDPCPAGTDGQRSSLAGMADMEQETKEAELDPARGPPRRAELPPLAQLIACLGTHIRSSRGGCGGRVPEEWMAPPEAIHHSIACDATGQSPIVGNRYTLPGANWDLCQSAFEALSEGEKLMYEIIKHPGATPVKYMDLASRAQEDGPEEQAAAEEPPVKSQGPATNGGANSSAADAQQQPLTSPLSREEVASPTSPSGSAEFEDLEPEHDAPGAGSV
eukprot:CAMPEP_0118962170 /NCGR_PEP_ID=MMETSP1173-20130426/595_1 /TAXON_ID=1034831 /ORGANISM="Rhizochromulina marina cf, Strain CCMP1243" /LENGTH=501 /DNA_ID=CAMNT_0006910393 /DNA_START=94 /DNA_END=1599 /DNA_ORIENTATION=-